MSPRTDWPTYYEANAEEIKARARRYYADNTEDVKGRVRRRYMEAKVAAVALLGGVCQRCGFAHPGALQFHHRDPATKKFNISSKTLTSPKKFPWAEVVEEIHKCDLLCANCHFIEHNTWKWPEREWPEDTD